MSTIHASAVRPFFSIIVPTMDRPETAPSAVSSALAQTFQDYEVIVSDNSKEIANAEINYNNINLYNKNNIRYVRPDEWLNMPDHWEFASRYAFGKYVIFLTDRFVLRPDALEVLHSKISEMKGDVDLLTWHAASSLSPFGVVSTAPFTGETTIYVSADFLREFAGCRNWREAPLWRNKLPLIISSCYKHELGERVRSRYGRIFSPISPDYTSAYLMLAHTPTFAYLDFPLAMNHGLKSNGREALVHGIDHYVSTLGEHDWMSVTPAPLPTVTNLIVRDLLVAKSLVGSEMADVEIDFPGYLMCNYLEFLQMERVGTQVNMQELYRLWWEATRSMPEQSREKLLEDVEVLERRRPRFYRFRRFVVRLGLDTAYIQTSSFLRAAWARLMGRRIYANALEAAAGTNYIIAGSRSERNAPP